MWSRKTIFRGFGYIVVLACAVMLSSCVTYTTIGTSRMPSPNQEMADAYTQADNAFRSGRYTEALEGYLDYISDYSPNTLTDNALNKAGDIYRARGELSSAQSMYLKIIQDFVFSDSYTDARYKLGQIYYSQGRYSDAINILASLVDEPGTGVATTATYNTLAKSYMMLGEYYDAVFWFNEAARSTYEVSVREEAEENIKLLLENYLDEEDLEDIAEEYDDTPAGGYAAYILAQRYISRGDLDDARSELLKIVRNQPDHEYYYEAQGMLKETQGMPYSSEITVGVILPLSGRAAVFGRKVRNGLELASGALGYTDGPRIRLIFKDSGSDETTASYAVKELARDEDVVLIIGPMLKDTALAAAREAQLQGVPIITLTKEQSITDLGEYVFRNFLTNPDEISGLVRYVVQGRGVCRFAILYPDDAYGQEMKELFSRYVGYYGCSIVGELSYTGETADFRSIIKDLLDLTGSTKSSTTFDALFIPDYYNTVGLVIPYVYYYNLKSITLLGTDGWNDPAILDIAGDFMIGSYFADAFTPDSDDPAVKSFVEDFTSIFGFKPGVLEAYGYDTIRMVQYLVRSQGVDGRDDMRDALLSIRGYEGVTGLTTIERNGDSTKDPLILTVMESEAERTMTITEEPEEGVAIAAELNEDDVTEYVIVEVPDSRRY